MKGLRDKSLRSHVFYIYPCNFDVAKSSIKLGVMVLLKKSIRSRQMVVNEINLGGSIELIHNTISITEIAVEKGTPALLMPVTIRY